MIAMLLILMIAMFFMSRGLMASLFFAWQMIPWEVSFLYIPYFYRSYVLELVNGMKEFDKKKICGYLISLLCLFNFLGNSKYITC